MTDQEVIIPPPIRDIPHLTAEERVARGKGARAETPRRSQSAWEPWDGRPDPVALLESQSESRMQDLVPIRYGRMAASPFAFFRGGALVMASDLATTPRTGLKVQLCGDAHLSNFGVFGSPERDLLFDINDFDETAPGPWEFDVKRLAASFEIAGRDRAFEPAVRRRIVLECLASYREEMVRLAQLKNFDVWYSRIDVSSLVAGVRQTGSKADGRAVIRTAEKARLRDSTLALKKLTHLENGEPRITFNPPLTMPARNLLTAEEMERFPSVMEHFLAAYRASLPDDRRHLLDEYRFVQIARKVVGVGSVGTRSWIVLMLGRDNGDPLFLQMKEATDSVLERFVGRSRYRHRGRRVVEGQRLMQAASDLLLGWYRIEGFDGKEHDFYVRQLWDGKASFDPKTMSQSLFAGYAFTCGQALARAHARSGDRIAIASYLGRRDLFDAAVADFSAAYADQNERDFEALQAAIASGRIVAQTGI